VVDGLALTVLLQAVRGGPVLLGVGVDRLPEAVRLPRGRLPQADRAVLAARRVHLPVGAVLDGMHGPMVPLVHLLLLHQWDVIHRDGRRLNIIISVVIMVRAPSR